MAHKVSPLITTSSTHPSKPAAMNGVQHRRPTTLGSILEGKHGILHNFYFFNKLLQKEYFFQFASSIGDYVMAIKYAIYPRDVFTIVIFK